MFINRLLADSILRASESFPVILLTGPRQTGKTTLLLRLAETRTDFTYISMDSPETRRLATEEPGLLFQRFTGNLLIDEIQYAPNILPYIKMIVDRDRYAALTGKKEQRAAAKFWLTGSQQFQMMKGVSESLAGRVAIFRLQSLSHSEIAGTGFGPFTTDKEELVRRLKTAAAADGMSAGLPALMPVSETFRAIFQGGMPEIAAKNADREHFFSSYLQTYLERDIRDLVKAGNELQFYRFLQVCAARTATTLVYENIADDCGISIPTVKQWISILVSTGIIALVQPWFPNVLKRIVKSPKLYFLDTGLCAYLLSWPTPQTLEAGPLSGFFFETWVVSELYKSFLNAGREPSFYHYRDKDKKEIELLIHENGLLHPIEIKKTASPTKSMIASFAVLAPLNEALNKAAQPGDAPNDTSGEAPYEAAAGVPPYSPLVGSGALICQYPDVLPLDKNNCAVPVGLI